MTGEEQSSKSFFERGREVGLYVLKPFQSTINYRFKSYSLFLSTREGVDKHIEELERLESGGYFSSNRDFEQLVLQTNHERDVIQNSYETLVGRTRIYFSLAAIMAIIALGIITDSILITRIQDHLKSDFPDKLIVWVSLVILLYLILMSIFTLSLVLRNYSSVWSRYTKVSYGGFDIATRLLGWSDQTAINMELYTIAKAEEYSTESTVMADNYWRALLSDSIYRLVGAVTMAVFFSLYLALKNPEPGVQIGHIVYGTILLALLITILIKERIDVLYLIGALYSPIKKIDREMDLNEVRIRS